MSERFELPAELTIYSAVQTRDALLAWATTQMAKAVAQPKVSAANVTMVDGAGIQLLAALSNMGVSWQLVDASPVFIEACRTLGLRAWLDSPYLQNVTAGEAA